jgi:hypothetical protein
MLKGGDYSALRRNFPRVGIPDYLKEHFPSDARSAGDLGGILGREMEFADSRQHVGLQIADALTNSNCVRRALIGNIQADGWRPLRKLMIRQREGAVKFITMGEQGGFVSERPYALIAEPLAKGERSMVAEGRGGSRAAREARAGPGKA